MVSLDVEQADRLLTTTRAVRRRLDLERDVPNEVLLAIIDVAEQAPTGSNQASRRWVVVRHPATKKALADLYREAGAGLMRAAAEPPGVAGAAVHRVFGSAAHLAENLERVPALVVLGIWGVHDGSSRPGLFDSVIQSGWSFCLAARARGLGTAWTTMHLSRADEVAGLLGLPPGFTQVVLLPVAYTVGDEFKPVARRPATEITYFDQWGFTDQHLPADRRAHAAEGRGVSLEIDVAASAERVWELVSDIDTPARHCREAAGAEWDDDGPRGVGSTFRGRNETDDVGHPLLNAVLIRRRGAMRWETPCTVTVWEPGRAFAYEVGEPGRQWARWSFTIQPLLGGGVRVGHSMVHLGSASGTVVALEENPDQTREILDGRFRCIRRNLTQVLTGIKVEAEGTVDVPGGARERPPAVDRPGGPRASGRPDGFVGGEGFGCQQTLSPTRGLLDGDEVEDSPRA
jgi:nitroreductase